MFRGSREFKGIVGGVDIIGYRVFIIFFILEFFCVGFVVFSNFYIF